MSSHWDRDIVIPVNPALANLLTEAEKQGEEMRQRALARLRKHKGPLAQPTCENCKYSNLAHPPEDHCYMFREKPKNVPIEVRPCGQWDYPFFPSG